MDKNEEIKLLKEIKKLYCVTVSLTIEQSIKNTIKGFFKISDEDELVDACYKKVRDELNKSYKIAFSNYQSEEGLYIYQNTNIKYDDLKSQYALITNDNNATLKLVKFEAEKSVKINFNINNESAEIIFNILKFDIKKAISYSYQSSQTIWAQRSFVCCNKLLDQSYRTIKTLDVYQLTLEGKKDFTFLTSDYDFSSEDNKRNFYVGDEYILGNSGQYRHGDIAFRLKKSEEGLRIKDYAYYNANDKKWETYNSLDSGIEPIRNSLIKQYLSNVSSGYRKSAEEIEIQLGKDEIYKFENGRKLYDIFSSEQQKKVRKQIRTKSSQVKTKNGAGGAQEDKLKGENKELDKFANFGNVIFYGVPGCGKSYFVKKLLGFDEVELQENYSRVLFHPEYTYGDFVGQLQPTVKNGKPVYEFVAGPFTEILKKAILNHNQKYYLIIEEINRGNAPEIFGDIFQLLDRNSDGRSEYKITNNQILNFIKDKNDKLTEDKKEMLNNLQKIYLPENLIIFATMNTCDQNVFTLDTAFKRRWRMHRIENSFEQKTENSSNAKFNNQLNHKIGGTALTWANFAKVINAKIVEQNNSLEEDKQLGVWFVGQKELDDILAFSEKVFMYLWNDVFKYDRQKIFSTNYKTLDEIINKFSKDNVSIAERLQIFNDEIQQTMNSKIEDVEQGQSSSENE